MRRLSGKNISEMEVNEAKIVKRAIQIAEDAFF